MVIVLSQDTNIWEDMDMGGSKMKLRCIESCNKRFIVNKEYEAVEIKTDYENPLYRIKDEDNIKVRVILKGLLWKFEIVKEN